MQHPIQKVTIKENLDEIYLLASLLLILPLLILEREGLYLSSFVMFQYSWYLTRRVRQLMSNKEIKRLPDEKSSTLVRENFKK